MPYPLGIWHDNINDPGIVVSATPFCAKLLRISLRFFRTPLAIFADKFAYIGTRERIAMEETVEAKGAVAYAEAIDTIAAAGGFSDERARKVLHALVCTRSNP